VAHTPLTPRRLLEAIASAQSRQVEKVA
jgi:hypothetical protein